MQWRWGDTPCANHAQNGLLRLRRSCAGDTLAHGLMTISEATLSADTTLWRSVTRLYQPSIPNRRWPPCARCRHAAAAPSETRSIVTTCPRCGQPLRAPVAACPRCGQRFAPPAQPPQSAQPQNGYGGYNGNPGYNTYDDATPAWMQQARPQAPQPPQPPQPPRQPQQPYQQPPQQPPAYGQPAPQQGARPGFSVNELVSEEALPDWLKQASADSAQPTQRQPTPGAAYSAPQARQPYPPANVPAVPASSPAYPVAYPPANQLAYGGFAPMPAEEPPAARPDASAFPSIESAGSYQAPLAGGGGLPAGSLLDPNALPGWLSGQQGQAASVSMRSGEGMRAHSLIDDTALPEWIRNEPQGNGNGTAGAAALAPARAALPPAAPAWGGYPVPAPVSPATPASPAYPAYPAAPATPMAPTAGAYPQAGYGSMQPPALTPMDGRMNGQMNGQQGFSARDLVDPDAMPSWAQPAPEARAAQPQGGAGQWSASDLIDPAMLPGWVRENDAATPQGGAQPGLTGQPAPAAMPSSPAYDAPQAPRERTGRVPAPQGTRPGGDAARPRVPGPEQAEQDFGASRAGGRGSASRKYPAARPLDDDEKPAWLREGANENDGYDGYDGYGPPDRSAYPAGRANGRPERDQGEQNGQNGRSRMNGPTSHTARRRQAPRQQPADQSWAAPDGYDDSPWGRSQATPRGGQHGGQRGAPRDAQPAAKKRKGGFLGFLRRG